MSLLLVLNSVLVNQTLADLTKGVTAYRDGDFKTAYAQLLRAATTDDPKAQYLVGSMHEDGLGVTANDTEAARWYQQAIAHGTPEPQAQVALAYLYLEGRGVVTDAKRALALFKAAATSKPPSAEAVNAVGALYARGQGVERSAVKALAWYQRAADLGHAGGMYNLAHAYCQGEGITVSLSQAIAWYRRAAFQWHIPAQINLAYIYAKGNGGHDVEKNHRTDNGEEVQANYIKAYAWLRIASATGNNTAKENLEILKERMTDQEHAKGDKYLNTLSKQLPSRRRAEPREKNTVRDNR